MYFVSSRFGTSLLVWLVVGIALALPAGLWILQVNTDQMTAEWQGRPGLSVYFELQVRQEDVASAAHFLAQRPHIDHVEVTTAEEALVEFKAMSGINEALDLLAENPLPASLKARFADLVPSAELNGLIQAVQGMPGVAEVVVEKTWIERLNDISTILKRLGLVLAVLFGLGAVLVTASSVRLAIENRLEELRVLLLVGATRGQLRRPFLYFGAIYGFGGAVIAAMLIAVTVAVLEPPLNSLLGSYQQSLKLAGFNPMFLMSLLMLGSALGVTGALLAVRQRLSRLEIF